MARRRLQKLLSEYYAKDGHHHEDAAGIVKARAAVIQKYEDRKYYIGYYELALLHVATSNTVPTLFWFLSCIITRPALVDRLRVEATALVGGGPAAEVTVRLDSLADSCPLLVSCYREAIRLYNKAMSIRRVMSDTTISDGKGHTYLLRKGVDVMMPAEPMHHNAVWTDPDSPPVTEFWGDRFLEQNKNTAQSKARRASYMPFGGGRHLCPGRNFAFAENLGFAVTFLLSFDIAPVDGDWAAFKLPEPMQCSFTTAEGKPVKNGDGFGMRLRRRAGWESVKWHYTSGDF